jgi:hypothetical protein
MSRFTLLLAFLCSSAWSQADPDDIPDLERNPSLINTDLAQPNLSVTICKSTATQPMLERRSPGSLSDYREDNLVLLCAGKNQLELSSFCRMVCLRDITQEGMQAILAPDSRVEYDRVFRR